MAEPDYVQAVLFLYNHKLEETLSAIRTKDLVYNPEERRISVSLQKTVPPINLETNISQDGQISFTTTISPQGTILDVERIRRAVYEALERRLKGNLGLEEYSPIFLNVYRKLFAEPSVTTTAQGELIRAQIAYTNFINKLKRLYPLKESDLSPTTITGLIPDNQLGKKLSKQEALEVKLRSANVDEMLMRTGLRTLGITIRDFAPKNIT